MIDTCEKIQRLGKALASPARYKIVEALMGGPKSVNNIVTRVKLTQPAVSQHLKTLKLCGFVRSEKHGQEVRYSLDTRSIIDTLKRLVSGVERCKASKIHPSNHVTKVKV